MAKKFKDLVASLPEPRRVRAKLKARSLTNQMLLLKELRIELNLTQEQIAHALDISQVSVSQMESQNDMHISTLKKLINAMGGELEIVAKFKSGSVKINQFSN